MIDEEMKEEEEDFELPLLRECIEDADKFLRDLQARHRELTGRDYQWLR
jgi:hypothetical protein